MITIITIKSISIASLFILSIATGLIPYFLQKKLANSSRYLALSNALAGGVFFGAGILHLFADSSDELQPYSDKINYPIGCLCLCGGFLFTLYLELFIGILMRKYPSSLSNIGHGHSHGGSNDDSITSTTVTSSPSLIDYDGSSSIGNYNNNIHSLTSNSNSLGSSITSSINSNSDILYKNFEYQEIQDQDSNNNNNNNHKHNNQQQSVSKLRLNHKNDDIILIPTESTKLLINNNKQSTLINNQSLVVPLVLVIGLSVHSLFEGLALGIQETRLRIIDILVAVYAHKLLAAFALGVSIVTNQTNISLLKTSLIILVFSLSSPIGAIVGMLVVDGGGVGDLVPAILQGVASGTFLYVAAVEVIPKEMKHDSQDIFLKSILLLLGFSAMGIVSIWI